MAIIPLLLGVVINKNIIQNISTDILISNVNIHKVVSKMKIGYDLYIFSIIGFFFLFFKWGRKPYTVKT